MAGETFTLTVEQGGERLDRYVAEALPALSRTVVQRLIEGGEVTVNGTLTRTAYKVRPGDVVVVHVPPPEPMTLEAQPIALDVLYEDADILVLNKPAGLVVHPGAGNPDGTLVNAILAHCPDLQGIGGTLRPGIVHRLDKDTSGVMVVAKHDQAVKGLQQQFKERSMQKRYLALVHGHLAQPAGTVEAPIGRHRVQRQRMAVVAHGKPARTRWQVVGRYRSASGAPCTLVEVYLLTGRTHQIRVHFSWMGYPLVGDPVYYKGKADPPAPRQFLHATELAFVHPVSGEALSFRAPLPSDLQAVLDALTPTPD